MKKARPTLDDRIADLAYCKGVHRRDVHPGDLVLVTTRNSVYALRVLDEATYLVSGGWFDRQGLSPLRLTIAGCTWGGSLIKQDLIAACGMCLEFGNRIVTSFIQNVCVFRYGALN
jgi:hypothetical protein